MATRRFVRLLARIRKPRASTCNTRSWTRSRGRLHWKQHLKELHQMKRILLLGVTALSALLILFVSMPSGRAQQPTAGRGQQQPVESHAHGLDPADFDKTCKPCEDFFRFANGGWLTKNPIPAAYPSWGRDNILADHNLDILRQVLEEAAAKKNAAQGPVEQKIGDYYATCMDTTKIDA